MPIYDRPVRKILPEMIGAFCKVPQQTFTRQQAIDWFKENFPKILPNTVIAHLIRFSTNAPSRFHYSVKQPEEDLLFQIDSSRFRRYEPTTDPLPLNHGQTAPPGIDEDDQIDADEQEPGKQFAYEHDLRDFLARNLSLIESGLRLHMAEDGLTGVEYPVGGRFIDVLAKDRKGTLS